MSTESVCRQSKCVDKSTCVDRVRARTRSLFPSVWCLNDSLFSPPLPPSLLSLPSLPPCLSLAHTHSLSRALSLSLGRSLPLPLARFLSHTHSLSLSAADGSPHDISANLPWERENADRDATKCVIVLLLLPPLLLLSSCTRLLPRLLRACQRTCASACMHACGSRETDTQETPNAQKFS